MTVGENHPRTSKVLAMSDTSTLLVMLLRGGSSTTVRRKWSMLVFHSIPRVWCIHLERVMSALSECP